MEFLNCVNCGRGQVTSNKLCNYFVCVYGLFVINGTQAILDEFQTDLRSLSADHYDI